MPVKKKSAKSRASSRTRSRSPSAKRKGKKSAKSTRGSAKSRASTSLSERREADILDPAAMDNLYYITHNAADVLEIRGFGWPMATTKKGKKGKKKKK